jgi:phosphoribosyl-AMP cyclohydrolase
VCGGACPDIDFAIWTTRSPPLKPAGFSFARSSACGGNKLNLDFTKLDGLIPAVIQDNTSGRVLMVGFMSDVAFQRTVETGNVTFFSRSRNKLWMKGESSGHLLKVKEISTDCDEDSLLIKVDSIGPGVCHNGYESCFYRRLDGETWVETEAPTYDPKAIYGGTK